MEVRKYPFQAQNCPIKFASVGRASTIPLIKVDRWAKNLGWLGAPKFLTFRKNSIFVGDFLFIAFRAPTQREPVQMHPNYYVYGSATASQPTKAVHHFWLGYILIFMKTIRSLKVLCFSFQFALLFLTRSHRGLRNL